jgi:hypothetical protein
MMKLRNLSKDSIANFRWAPSILHTSAPEPEWASEYVLTSWACPTNVSLTANSMPFVNGSFSTTFAEMCYQSLTKTNFHFGHLLLNYCFLFCKLPNLMYSSGRAKDIVCPHDCIPVGRISRCVHTHWNVVCYHSCWLWATNYAVE